jgi:hypothetical protein
MSRLLEQPPYAPRDDDAFLGEMVELSHWHWSGCSEYQRIWADWSSAASIEDLPFLHVGLFKHLLLHTEGPGLRRQRVLTSSATTGASPSRILLDARSAALQTQSSLAILEELVGPERRPLLVLDSEQSLRLRGEISARIAAAMSLRPLASEIHFLLDTSGTVRWDQLRQVLRTHDDVLVYGLTWVLWRSWAGAEVPADVVELLTGRRVHFVHSGGWKKLEALRIDRSRFDEALLRSLAPESRVLDLYGLVEQVGLLYPLCEHGYRHVARWADMLVRDPWTLRPLVGEPGAIQLMNVLAFGAPYHNVLTEDLGRRVEGECPCGRPGRRFELLGRIPRADVRGCANV